MRIQSVKDKISSSIRLFYNYIAKLSNKSSMCIVNEQETIKNKLYAFDVEQNHYQSAELGGTLRNYNLTSSKNLSFRYISDWNDRYHIKQSALPQRQEQNNIEQDTYQQFRKFEFLLSAKHRKNGQIHSTSLQKKEKLCLSPIKMEFVRKHSKNKYKKEAEHIRRNEEQINTKSFYEINYESLNKLYRLRTNRKILEHKQHQEQLPTLGPQHANESRFPKSERMSSIMRLMKRNQQLRQLRRRDKNQAKMFIFAD